MRPNAIEPITWRAEYRGGGRLRQFDVDGLHYSREIDLDRISELVLEGVPGAGEVILEPHRRPDAVILMARNRITVGAGRRRWILAGFRYGDDESLFQIPVKL